MKSARDAAAGDDAKLEAARVCFDRIREAAAELHGLGYGAGGLIAAALAPVLEIKDRQAAVDVLLAQLEAIDLHRQIALDLINKIRPAPMRFRPDVVAAESETIWETLLGIDPIDLFIIVLLDAQAAPVSQNSVVDEIRERYTISRADCAKQLRELETAGVIERAKVVRGRGGGIRWSLVGARWPDSISALRDAR